MDENIRQLNAGEIPAVAPQPLRVSIDYFRDTKGDCQWIELEGIVRNAHVNEQHLFLEFGPPAQRVFFSIPWAPQFTNVAALARCRTRVRGVCTFDSTRPSLHAMNFAHSSEDLQVLTPDRPDPFEMPVKPIRSLPQAVPMTNEDAFVRVQGVITHLANAGNWHIQDGAGGAVVRSNSLPDARVGDEVDVVGFLSVQEHIPCVEDAEVRRLRRNYSGAF